MNVRTPITIAPAASIPTPIGTLNIANRIVQTHQIWTYSGACYVTIEYVSLNFVFQPSSELEPFKEVISYDFLIDNSPNSTWVHAPCDGADYKTGGLSLGQHVATVKAHITGANTDPPPLTMTFDLRCSELPSDADASAQAPDASAPEPDASRSVPPPSNNDAASNPNTMNDDGGCTQAPAATTSFLPAAMVGLFLLRRRQRRSSSRKRLLS